MGVGDLFRQHGDDRVAADVGAPPGDLAVRVEHDTVGVCIGPGEPGLPWIGPVYVIGISLPLGEFLTGDAADEPGVAAELLVQAFEQSRADPFGPPPAYQDAAVHARDHMADHKRLHAGIVHTVHNGSSVNSSCGRSTPRSA